MILFQAYSQEAVSVEKNSQAKDTLLKSDDDTRISIGNDLLSIDDSKDALKIRLGKHGVNILESLENGSKITFQNYDDWTWNRDNEDDKSDKSDNRRRHFRGHWAGFEFGFANYLTADRSFVLPSSINYMDLYSSKSNYFNINFAQRSFGLTRRLGFVTGLGLNFDSYRFSGDNTITTDANGEIRDSIPGMVLKKSKFRTLYLTMPLLLEAQVRTDHDQINVAAGLIGAVKLCNDTKIITESGDKFKSNDDFSTNLLRWGPTVRIGYGSLQRRRSCSSDDSVSFGIMCSAILACSNWADESSATGYSIENGICG